MVLKDIESGDYNINFVNGFERLGSAWSSGYLSLKNVAGLNNS